MKTATFTFAFCAAWAAHAQAQTMYGPHSSRPAHASSEMPPSATVTTTATHAPSLAQKVMTGTFDEVLFSEPGDGALWARGNAFKARFDGRGATVIPFFGSSAPQDYPLEMHASSATIGGQSLVLANEAKPTRVGTRVSIDHGSFVESWDLALDRLEQRFVFDARPGQGDLVVNIGITSELTGTDLGQSLRFENELGRVDYGEAFAIDATGRKIALESQLVDGVIRLVVPASFVASATLPLTIDPFVTFFTVSGTAHYEYQPDVSYDVTTDRWCVVWTDIFSATDDDVLARVASGNGTLGGTVIVDLSFDYWWTPKIANNHAENEFLVVAGVVPAPVGSNVSTIRGVLLFPGTGGVSGQLQISPNDGVYREFPDVGGDPNTGFFASNNYCVVWEKPLGVNNADIEMQIVTTAGGLYGAMTPIDNSSALDEYPRISKSLGLAAAIQPYQWTVAWQRRVTSSQHDIYGAQIGSAGQIIHPTFPIDTSPEDDTFPVPSTIMDPLPTYEERPYMVVYQRAYTDTDVMASVLKGTTLVLNTDLSGTFPAPFGNYNQTSPTVDCDGAHFLVGHVEQAFPSTDTNIWISDYYLSGNTLASCATHQDFVASPVAEGSIALCAMGSSGGAKQHFFGTWTYASINNQSDVQGGLWDSCAGGLVTPFCFGDGSGTACPCGNFGASGRGCATSLNPLGVQLSGTGLATLTTDTFTLSVSGTGPGSPCLYFQGTGYSGFGLGTAFGDGLRCVGGTTTRLHIVASDASGHSSFNGAPSSNLSILGGLPPTGGRLLYQAWFRDVGAFCTSSTFNLTNALSVDWGW